MMLGDGFRLYKMKGGGGQQRDNEATRGQTCKHTQQLVTLHKPTTKN